MVSEGVKHGYRREPPFSHGSCNCLHCITAETGRNDTIAPELELAFYGCVKPELLLVMDGRAYYSSLGLSELTLNGPRLQAMGHQTRGDAASKFGGLWGKPHVSRASNTKKGISN